MSSAVSFVTQHHGGWDIPNTTKPCVMQLDAQTAWRAKSHSGQSKGQAEKMIKDSASTSTLALQIYET